MTSALELAERRLGPDVLIVKSTDLGAHVEIEVERDPSKKNDDFLNKNQPKQFENHFQKEMSRNIYDKTGETLTAEKFLNNPENFKNSEVKSIEGTKKFFPDDQAVLSQNQSENLNSALDLIHQDIADLKALATSVIISDRLASNSVREEFLCLRLRELGFSPNLLFELLGGARKKQSVTLFSNMLAKKISINHDFKIGKKRIILASGASGSGKTTLVAKIAANLKIQGKKISLIDTDSRHIAAGDSLRCFGRMLDVEVLGINSETLPSLNDLLTRYDNLVVDMPSSLSTAKQLSNVFGAPNVIENVECYLATSCSTSQGLFEATVESVSNLKPTIALTKMDEAPIEFRLIDNLALKKMKIALVASGTDITALPDTCSEPFLAQYLLNELNSRLNWNENTEDPMINENITR